MTSFILIVWMMGSSQQSVVGQYPDIFSCRGAGASLQVSNPGASFQFSCVPAPRAAY